MTNPSKPLTNIQLIGLAWSIAGGWTAMLKSSAFWLSLLVSASCFPLWSGRDWCATVLSVVPSLLGFTLSGFAIFLSFGSDDFKLFLSRANELKSPYMSTSSAFLVFVLVQTLALLYAICAQGLYAIDRPDFLASYAQEAQFLSSAGGFVGYFLFVYGIVLSLRAALRIFRMSRWLHVLLLAQEEKKKNTPPASD